MLICINKSLSTLWETAKVNLMYFTESTCCRGGQGSLSMALP